MTISGRQAFCAGAALLTFAGITVGVATGTLTGFDQSVAGAVARHRVPALYWVARAGFSLGQNWAFPLLSAVLAIRLAFRRRTPLPILAAAGVIFVQNVVVGSAKIWAGRRPPVTGDPRLHAVTAELTQRMSFPSGHAANIVVYSALAGMLLEALTGRSRWRARLLGVGAGSLAVCLVCMLYLGFHWTTDAVAGLALGVVVRCVTAPAVAAALGREPAPS